jgi:hypothetical protein
MQFCVSLYQVKPERFLPFLKAERVSNHVEIDRIQPIWPEIRAAATTDIPPKPDDK